MFVFVDELYVRETEDGEHPTSREDCEVYAAMNANWVGKWARGGALIGAER